MSVGKWCGEFSKEICLNLKLIKEKQRLLKHNLFFSFHSFHLCCTKSNIKSRDHISSDLKEKEN